MNSRIRDIYLIIMYILGLVGIIILLASGNQSFWIGMIFSLGWLLSFTIRNLLLYNINKSFPKTSIILCFLEILLLIVIGNLGAGESIRVLLLISYADCIITWGMVYGVVFFFIALLGYLTFIDGLFYTATFKDIFAVIFKEAPILLLTEIISYLVGKVIKVNLLLENSIKDIAEREVKLSVAYQDLNRAYESLEEMTVLKERNRIAREIHDTVGHTLTTAIVEMEAGKMLFGKEPQKAQTSYQMAQSQVVKALNEMRNSVKMLSVNNVKNLKQIVTEIIEETCLHTGVSVKYEFDLQDKIRTEYDKLVVNALKEGFSNSIRHGKSTVFYFKLYINDDKLNFLLQDNGIGSTDFVPGFGLSNMKACIEQAGGQIEFRTEQEEGFEIKIALPLYGKGVKQP